MFSRISKRALFFVFLVLTLYITVNVVTIPKYDYNVDDPKMTTELTIIYKSLNTKTSSEKEQIANWNRFPLARQGGRKLNKYNRYVEKMIRSPAASKMTHVDSKNEPTVGNPSVSSIIRSYMKLNTIKEHTVKNNQLHTSATRGLTKRWDRKIARQIQLGIEKSQKSRARSSLVGTGEMGQPLKIDREKLSDKDKEEWDAGFERNSYNQFVSDKISVNRSLPDVRWPECKKIKYENLPQVSVVIPFLNESFTVLVRTVHSILNRSPPELLKEIILSDDASQMEHLGKPLDDYMSNFPKVSIKRLKTRQGLVQSRILGFNHSTAPVVIFMDSHCEVTKGWLKPLLDRIKRDYRTVVTSVIDEVDATDFHYDVSDQSVITAFNWNMLYEWIYIDYEDRIQPIRSATLVGCFIGVSRRFFKEIGMFDEGFVFWGAENLELSFKAWMCHGKVELIPCSRVGHLYKKGSLPYSMPDEDYRERNALRLAEVWLDEYKEFVYQYFGHDYVKNVDIGNVSDRKALRDKLKCNSFEWYIKEIAPKTFIPSRCHAWGPIRSMKYNSVCAEFSDESEFMKDYMFGGECTSRMENQVWYLCDEGIRRLNGCWSHITSDVDSDSLKVSLDECGNETIGWKYTEDNHIFNRELDKCLEIHDDGEITLEKCSKVSENQQWKWTVEQPPGPKPDL